MDSTGLERALQMVRLQVHHRFGSAKVDRARSTWSLLLTVLLCQCTVAESPNSGLNTAGDVTPAGDAVDGTADAAGFTAKPDDIEYTRVPAIPWPAAEANWCHKPSDFAPDAEPWACAPDWVVQCCHWNRPAPVTPKRLCEVVYCEDTAGDWRQMNAQGQGWSDPLCECAAMGPQSRLQCSKDQPALGNWTIANCSLP